MQISVTNLHTNLIESDVQRMFRKYGEVTSVTLMRDKWNNRFFGRAFVDMPVAKEAGLAILSLNGTDVRGKKIVVAEIFYDPTSLVSRRFGKNN